MKLKKTHYIGLALLIIAAALPVIVSLSQKPQETRSRASSSTTLSISPQSSETAPIIKNTGDQVALDVFIEPGNSLPSLVKLDISFDQTKLKPDDVPFVINTTAFPSKIEGPVILDGHVLISLSIGSDSTKAIQTRTKVGTVQFVALAATTGTTVVGFGNRSQVLSVAATDNSTQNVLSTSTPGYIKINGTYYPSPTPTYAPTAYPTQYPTAYPTAYSTPYPSAYPTAYATSYPTPTQVVYPTATPIVYPTIPPYSTTLSFDIQMHGIGSSGDNVNPISTLSNKEPRSPQRTIEVQVFNSKNTLVKTTTGVITYNTESGSFLGQVDLGPTFAQGQYSIKVKEQTHLRRLIPGIITITPYKDHKMPKIALVAGDINNDNFINIVDYNILIGCYSDIQPADSCNEANKNASDINDDGAVNQFDYNLFLREITVQPGS